MTKILMTLYAVASYCLFLAIFLLLVGFVGDFPLPKTIDRGTQGSLTRAVVCNVLLISLFGLQHSVMARPGFKRWWTRLVAEPIERSTYVLIASLLLGLVMWQWRPIPEPVLWDIQQSAAKTVIVALFWAGWAVLLASTYLINHFELFGLRQVHIHLMGRQLPEQQFRTPLLYRRIRHPIYLGFLIAFWAAPRMTLGHLLFALVWTAYILIGIYFEERDLLTQFGARYLRYRQEAGMLFPSLRKRER